MSRQTILCVDDETISLALLRSALEEDYDLAFATDGDEALRIWRQRSIDLVLLDVEMPGLDGYYVARRMSEGTTGRRVPIVFVTARSGQFDEEAGFEAGGVDYITKPISPKILLARVKAHLSVANSAKLEAREKALSEQSQQQADFISAVGRELLTPLHALHEAFDRLADGTASSDDIYGLIAFGQRNCIRLEDMVETLVDFRRSRAGRIAVEMEPVDVGKIVEDVVRCRESGFTRAGVALEFVPPPEAWEAYGDRRRLSRLVDALLSNALKVSPEGQAVRVSISGIDVLPGARGNGGVRISVADQGPGIAEAAN